MRFTDFFIRRPIFAFALNVVLLIAGFQAITALSVRQYPRSDVSSITIKTVYVGASAELVRGFITTPLERVIASADGIEYLESESAQGMSTITVRLKLNYDVNAALTQVQSKVAQVRNELPPEAEQPIINVESADGRFASMYIGFNSDVMAPNQITDYLTRVVQPRMSAIPGVQRADILGGRTFAMRIWLKPDRMAALGVSALDIQAALNRNNYLAALGNTKGSMVSVNLTSNTDLRSREEFEALVVLNRGDTLVRLRDVADVVLGAENYDEEVRFGGKRATFMGIWPLPTANVLEVVKGVRAAAPEIAQNLPEGLHMEISFDATRYINDAIHEVVKTLSETIAIVILVIFLFIGSFRSILVPVVAIPLSLVGAAALMYLCGFTINLLTLLAIVLSVGIVVDDAIVMLENIERHVQEGMKPFEAALQGARELFAPTLAMTITLTTVYAPIAMQGGLTGTLFREFAFTLAGAVLVSGFVALTLSPMMSSKLLHVEVQPSRVQRVTQGIFDAMRSFYVRALAFSLQHRTAVLLIAATFMVLIPIFSLFSTRELAPREDQGVVFSILQAAPSNTIEQTMAYATLVDELFRAVPEARTTFQLVNRAGGFSGAPLKAWKDRNRSAQALEGMLWGQASMIPGLRVIVTTPPPLPGGSNYPVEFVVASTADSREIVDVANTLVQRAYQSGLFMFVDTDLKFDQPEGEIHLDRDKVAALGLDLRAVGSDLSWMLGGNWVNRFNIAGRSYKVIPQVKRTERLTAEQVLDLYVRTPGGQTIPVSTIASVDQHVRPRSLKRFQQLNSAMIFGAPRPGASINEALSYLETEAAQLMPSGYSIDYAGESRQLRTEGTAFVSSMILALMLIYLVLAAQFESFLSPLIILLGSVPLALSGALLFSFLGFTSINVYSQVGLITLVGLVAKNGILIVDFANRLVSSGARAIDAIQQAAATRFRPVMMTSLATIVGHFPLVLATGAGAGARNSIGIMLVTGMIIGTLFTLLVLPSIYLLFIGGRESRLLDTAEHA